MEKGKYNILNFKLYYIIQGQVFKLDLVMASVIILALISAIMYQAVVIVEKAVQKTHKFV